MALTTAPVCLRSCVAPLGLKALLCSRHYKQAAPIGVSKHPSVCVKLGRRPGCCSTRQFPPRDLLPEFSPIVALPTALLRWVFVFRKLP